jgi:hypothetical protein
MVAENIHFTCLRGKALASALWPERVVTPAFRFQTSFVPEFFSDMLWLVLVTWTWILGW